MRLILNYNNPPGERVDDKSSKGIYSLEHVTRFSCQRISPVREWRVDQTGRRSGSGITTGKEITGGEEEDSGEGHHTM